MLEKDYDSFKIDIRRRTTFDPRPTIIVEADPVAKANDLLAAISGRNPQCMWSTLMEIKYTQPVFDEDDKLGFEQMREVFLVALAVTVRALAPNQRYQGPVEFCGTELQSHSEMWTQFRSLFVTASKAHDLAHMQSDNARKQFLRNHLWGFKKIQTKGMKYGTDHEEMARQAYIEMKKESNPFVNVQKAGLVANTKFLGIACSPDGYVKNGVGQTKRLLEIKCPFTLRNHHPNLFTQVLKPKQLERFPLMTNPDGSYTFKKNHSWYDQMQVQMAVTEVYECDFFMWSEKGYLCETIHFDSERWEFLKRALTTFHRCLLAVDYVTMLTPRNLSPLFLD